MKFKLVETVELSERGPRGQGNIWKPVIEPIITNSNIPFDMENHCLHHINSIHTDNSDHNRVVIPNDLHRQITNEINKECKEYLIKEGVLQDISKSVWKKHFKESDLIYDKENNLLFIKKELNIN